MSSAPSTRPGRSFRMSRSIASKMPTAIPTTTAAVRFFPEMRYVATNNTGGAAVSRTPYQPPSNSCSGCRSSTCERSGSALTRETLNLVPFAPVTGSNCHRRAAARVLLAIWATREGKGFERSFVEHHETHPIHAGVGVKFKPLLHRTYGDRCSVRGRPAVHATGDGRERN